MSEISPKATKIDKLLNNMEEGDIKIPAFQRGLVWKQGQVIDLVDSIYNDYPIGSILLWNSIERLRSTRNIGGFIIPDRVAQYPVNYVLDGQQRLSTIYALFCKDRRIAPDVDEYKVDPSIFNIYFDLDTKKFIPSKEIDGSHTNLQMSLLFNNFEFNKATRNYGEEYLNLAVELQSKFQNYEIPIVTTYKRSKEDVGIIFERINNTGTKLSTLDLMIAWTWSDDFHLKEEIKTILSVLEEKNFGDTDEKIILQCLSAITQKTTKTKDILSLEPVVVKNNIPVLRDSLEKAVDFLSTEFNVISNDFLPQSHQIIPFTYFFSKVKNPSAPQIRILKKWFWRTSFSLRYAGATDIRLNQDILFIDRVIMDAVNVTGLEKYSPTLTEVLIINPTFAKTNVFTRSLLLLLAQKKPLDLTNGKIVDLGLALSKYNKKEYHHIFPQAFLKERGVAENKINSICNFCYLPSDSNKKISKKAPSDYIFNLVPVDHYEEILSSNLMPLKREIYLENNYDEFLKQRALMIIQFLDSLMG